MEEIAQEIKNLKKKIWDYIASTGKSEQQLFEMNDLWLKQLLKKEEQLLKKEEQLREERLILLRQQQQAQQGRIISLIDSLNIIPMESSCNLQHDRLGYCYFMASLFDVKLDLTNLPSADYDRNTQLLAQIMKCLEKRKIKKIVFDESQRQLGLIEFVVKEKHGGPGLIITGTPPHGQDSIDYGGSVHSRVGMFLLSDLRPPHVKEFLRVSFNADINPICVLNFWTLFGGSPYFYQVFGKEILPKLTTEIKNEITSGGKFPKDVLLQCIQLQEYSSRGISKELLIEFPATGKNRKDISQKYQRDVAQLFARSILANTTYLSDQTRSRVTWTESPPEEQNILKQNWSRCRGMALEAMIRKLVEEVLLRRKADIIGLPHGRYEIYEYFFDATDADVLLREKDPSLDDIDQAWIRHWVVFNIKTRSAALTENDSVDKFSKLCNKIVEQEERRTCSIALIAAEIDEAARKEIKRKWANFDINGIYDLSYFFEKLPKPISKIQDEKVLLERDLEKQRLRDSVLPILSLSGRYRCGKTTLVKDLCNEDEPSIYVELPEGKIQPLAYKSSNC